jgi:signal transduction histidine kinase
MSGCWTEDEWRMVRISQPEIGEASRRSWTAWRVFGGTDPSAGNLLLRQDQLRTFRLVVTIAAAGLLVMVLRGILVGGPFPWDDLINAVSFLAILLLVTWEPRWLRLLSWLGLAAFFVNAVDGLVPVTVQVIRPAHVLVPLLVLYGALLGDLWLSLAAMIGVLGVYAFTWLEHRPLPRTDLLILTNLSLATVASGLAALGVRFQHRRFTETLRLQAEHLRKELDTRLRLNAIIFHDIRNPLGALMAAGELARTRPRPEPEDLETIDVMSKRIRMIINSAHEIGGDTEIALAGVPVVAVWERLQGLFSARLAAKDQKLVPAEDAEFQVRTNLEILCNSVLGNVLDNAIKFSPRGAVIQLAAEAEGETVRLEVRDRGPGFPAAVLHQGARGRRYLPSVGSEGEIGSAHGLRIAALCLQRLGGRLEVRNRDTGGAAVAIVLPRAEAADRRPT